MQIHEQWAAAEGKGIQITYIVVSRVFPGYSETISVFEHQTQVALFLQVPM